MNTKTKLNLVAAALIVGVGVYFFGDWNNQPVNSVSPVSETPVISNYTAATDAPALLTESQSIAVASADAPVFYQTAAEAATLHMADTRFENVNHFQFPTLLAELERMPESPVKNDMMRDALKKWATLDGAAAAKWAKLLPARRHFLPDILQTWASTDAKAASSAWAFAKAGFAADGNSATWHAPGFVKAAFGGMTARPGNGWWNELAGLSGTPLVQAMFGAADFASNRQVNTDFSAAMEERVLNSNSAVLAASFYAAAGHITAAKEQLRGVADVEQWHDIAREVARQQAEFEPVKAIEWLESQFTQPSEAIEDVVNSVGFMDALNGREVLVWLNKLPDSAERTAGIEQIQQAFPSLRPNLPAQEITLE